MSERDPDLDARLRAAFAPPSDVGRMARDVLERSAAVRPVRRLRLLRSMAAILLVAASLGWVGWLAMRDANPPSPTLAAVVDAAELHARIRAELGDPQACTSPEEAIPLVTQCVGTRLDYLGGARVPLQGPFTPPPDWPGDSAATVLAGHSDGRVVVVVMETVGTTCGPVLRPSGDLLVHRREVGGYILHEISSGEAPVCLDEFHLRTN